MNLSSSAAMPTIQLNGEPTSVEQLATITDLLRARQLDRAPCAVEVNRKVVPRREHDSVTLNEGDIIEIVTLVGGG